MKKSSINAFMDSLLATGRRAEQGEKSQEPEHADELRGLWKQLGSLPPVPMRPAGQEPRFLSNPRARADAVFSEFPGARSWSSRWWQWGGAAAAVVALVAISHTVTLHRSMSRMENEMFRLRETILATSLSSDSAANRIAGLAYLSADEPPPEPVLALVADRVVSDPNVNVRIASIQALRPYARHPLVADLARRMMATANSPLVRLALLELLEESDPAAAEAAWDAWKQAEPSRFPPARRPEPMDTTTL